MKFKLSNYIDDYLPFWVGIIFFVSMSALYVTLKNPIAHFIQENLSTITTLTVGLFAFFLYKKQLKDQKSDAAKIILLEIQNAETGFRQISRDLAIGNDQLSEDIVIMPTESWSKFKHFFVEDFDRSQWDAISDYYAGCFLLDEALRDNNSHFRKNEEQFRINIQRISAQYIEDALKDKTQTNIAFIERDLSEKIERLRSVYLKVAKHYDPRKPLFDAKRIIAGIDTTLSRTSVGTVLKNLSNQS